jgi:hypothetical protein
MRLSANLFRREIIPHVLAFSGLVAATLVIDLLLHLAGAVWAGRYLGVVGTLLIIGSFGYSLRKRKIISVGKPVLLLRLHEGMSWAGSLFVLVHAGIHFNGALAWLAVAAMLVNVGSGLAGKFLLTRARQRLGDTHGQLSAQGLTEAAIDDRLHFDSLTLDVVKQWRVVHFPITVVFMGLALAHIMAICVFWGWR